MNLTKRKKICKYLAAAEAERAQERARKQEEPISKSFENSEWKETGAFVPDDTPQNIIKISIITRMTRKKDDRVS